MKRVFSAVLLLVIVIATFARHSDFENLSAGAKRASTIQRQDSQLASMEATCPIGCSLPHHRSHGSFAHETNCNHHFLIRKYYEPEYQVGRTQTFVESATAPISPFLEPLSEPPITA